VRYGALVAGTFITLCAVLLLNYACTGLFLDIPLEQMWKMADQSKFSSWSSPYLPLYFIEGSEGNAAKASYAALFDSALSQSYWIKPINHKLTYWINLFRFADMPAVFWGAGALLLMTSIALTAFLFARKRVEVRWDLTSPLLMLPFVAFLATALPGYAPNIYRNYGFMALVTAGLVCLLWKISIDSVFPKYSRPALYAILVCGAVFVTVSASLDRIHGQRTPGAPTRWSDFFGFAVGSLSVQDALARGDGLWAAGLEAKKHVPKGEKVFCFNNGFPGIASHLFPSHGLITEPSRSGFDGKWQDIAFTNPVIAQAELQKQKINYKRTRTLETVNARIF
jgi:hypothetical protein